MKKVYATYAGRYQQHLVPTGSGMPAKRRLKWREQERNRRAIKVTTELEA